ncbi:MAG: hypothetical protein ACJAVT_002860 [Yoonia sp.]|jgi:hypothetical protein
MDHALCGWREKGNRGGGFNESLGKFCFDTEVMTSMKSVITLACEVWFLAACGGGGTPR